MFREGRGNKTVKTPEKQKRFTKSQIQRFRKQQRKKDKATFIQFVVKESQKIKNQNAQILRRLIDKIKIDYGFIADYRKTPLHNASNLLADMPSWYYFARPTNIAFHNLLPSRPSYSFRSLLVCYYVLMVMMLVLVVSRKEWEE